MTSREARQMIARIGREPPFRLLTRLIVKQFLSNPAVRARWGVDPYPAYLYGMLEGALLAKRQGISGITAVEFGVASGGGLLAMEQYARRIEQFTGIVIKVVGFDTGSGLPAFIGDYRDHPDHWQTGAYPLADDLRGRIDPASTRLVIGDVRQTVPAFLKESDFLPLGFVSFDLDLYSSTRDALQIFDSRERKMLRQTPIYFDDIDFISNHRWAGELLAIEEFNRSCDFVKIDHWYNLKSDKPFPEAYYWEKLMVAHDLEAISRSGSNVGAGAVSL
ncbi:MAG: hypothetical protein JO007_22285 [Alphaproteobacteria bacterium]|nr:hypothetical protein [Alphaproteobacteria bacterium]